MSFRNYLSYSDNERTRALIYTIDVDKISNLKDLSWVDVLTSKVYQMKAPDVWLVDSIDP